MVISLLVMVVVFLFAQGSSIVVEDADVVTDCVDDHQFLFFYEAVTFDLAVTRCSSLAPDADVGSGASVLASLQNAKDISVVGVTLFNNASLQSVWVGIFRNANQANFQFVDAAANANTAAISFINPGGVSILPFTIGQPDISSNSKACLLFDTTIDRTRLSDADCTIAQPGYVCRRNCTLAPTTSPTLAPTRTPIVAPTRSPTTPTVVSSNSDGGNATSDAPDLTKAGTIIGVLAFCCFATASTAIIIVLNRHDRSERAKKVSGMAGAVKDLRASQEMRSQLSQPNKNSLNDKYNNSPSTPKQDRNERIPSVLISSKSATKDSKKQPGISQIAVDVPGSPVFEDPVTTPVSREASASTGYLTNLDSLRPSIFRPSSGYLKKEADSKGIPYDFNKKRLDNNNPKYDDRRSKSRPQSSEKKSDGFKEYVAGDAEKQLVEHRLNQ